jgi:hypothetical protein
MYENIFKINNLTLENFHGQLIDYLMKTNLKYTNEYDLLDEPYALFRHLSESSRFHHKLVKTQMLQVNPLIEPELHDTLCSLAEHLLQLWILSTESVKNYEIFHDEGA